MAIIWAATLIALSSPIINTWAISARSQENLLLSGRIDAEDFDFGYLQFKLGRYGERAAEKLAAAKDHPQADAIATGIERARNASSYWEYHSPTPPPKPTPAPVEPSGPEALDFNPPDNPDKETDPPADDDAQTLDID